MSPPPDGVGACLRRSSASCLPPTDSFSGPRVLAMTNDADRQIPPRRQS